MGKYQGLWMFAMVHNLVGWLTVGSHKRQTYGHRCGFYLSWKISLLA